ncbi:MAG: hypothetical protein SGILL_010081, partial [Bacillariaceae sp.]
TVGSNDRGFKFYVIEVPFLTTDLLASEENRTRAKNFYQRTNLNEDISEIWIYRGLKHSSLNQSRTHDPSQADVFFIAGLNNLRFAIFKFDFPRGQALDDILRPYIFNATKPHVMATPRTRNRIGLNHMVDSLKRLGVNPHALGYERSPFWQSVAQDRIVTVPYVVKPSQSKDELQTAIRSIPRNENFTFYAGDTRPLASRFGGCDRTNLIKNIPQNRTDTFVRLFFNKRHRLSQQEYNHRMETSDYCLIVCGDTPTSRSLASAMVAGCIPIFIGSRWRGFCEPPCHSGWGWQITNGMAHFPYPHELKWDVFPEVDEATFANDPVTALQEVFAGQSPARRLEIRAAMAETQLHWIYGWDNPVDSERIGEATSTIWKSVVQHLLTTGDLAMPEEGSKTASNTSEVA